MKKAIVLFVAAAMILGMAAPAWAEDAAVNEAPTAEAAVSGAPADEAGTSEAPAREENEWAPYDKLIEDIRKETDTARRAEMMHEAENILMATYCVVPVYYYNDSYLQREYVDGIYASGSGTKYVMYAALNNGSDTLKLQLSSDPAGLDPAQNRFPGSDSLFVSLFSGLYTYNAEGHTVPACAEGYQVSDDGRTITVTLKKDLKWSDGRDLTAEDFVYAWKRAAKAQLDAENTAALFGGFEGFSEGNINVTAKDDTTLEFVLTAPCVYIEDLMASVPFLPVPKAFVEEHKTDESPDTWSRKAGFPSNGPFMCTEWTPGLSMTLEKNPYWYDADAVTAVRLELMLSSDDAAVYTAYSEGAVDFAELVPVEEAEYMLAVADPQLHVINTSGTFYLVFNSNSTLFADKTKEQAAVMREAFSLLIDRTYIIENIGLNGQMAANAFIPIGMSDGNKSIYRENLDTGYFDPYAINNEYDGTVAIARELLRSAGFEFNESGILSEQTPITMNYLTNDSAGQLAVARAIQQDFDVLGIQMSIRALDEEKFLEERKNGSFDLARGGCFADFNDPVSLLARFTTVSGFNDCGFGK